MHIRFAKYFVDPFTKEPLSLKITDQVGSNVITGCFKSASRTFPIIRGIPRFVGESLAEGRGKNYTNSFGYQWNKWSRVQFESENINGPMAGHTRTMWERIVGNSIIKDSDVVLDIGCGSGRFIDIARSRGASVIGIDFSEAVEAAQEIFDKDQHVCICQADALNLPIVSNSIDGAYSIGVLHHTPAPEAGIKEASRVLRPEGWFAVAVYGKGGYYDFPSVQLWRKFFKFLWPIFGHYPPLIYSYIVTYGLRPLARISALRKAMRLLFPFVYLPDIRWSLLDTFDSVTPSYQSAHESFEVHSWFKNSGFYEIEPSNWSFTAYHGKKMDNPREAIQTISAPPRTLRTAAIQ